MNDILEYLKKDNVGIIVCNQKGNIIRMSLCPSNISEAENWYAGMVKYLSSPLKSKLKIFVKYSDSKELCGIKVFEIDKPLLISDQ